MTMLTHARGSSQRPISSSERQDAAGADAAEARLAKIKRFGICALTLLLAGAPSPG
jgi:hypothetical protein